LSYYTWGSILIKQYHISLVIIISFFFLSPIIIGTTIPHDSYNQHYPIPTDISTTSSGNQGKRWDINNVTIVYLNGTFYEMGYELGALIKNEILVNNRAFIHFYEGQGIYKKELLDMWNIQRPYVPDELIEYIQGCADALTIPFEDVACVWVAEGTAYAHKCSSFAAWGPATKDGKLIQMRSLEFPLCIKDPLTGRYIQDYPILIIADPLNYTAFMYPTYAGYVMEDGINEKGICVTNMWSPNNDQTCSGEPMGIRLFEALYTSSSAQEAIEILSRHRTFGYNFIVSDSKIPAGYAVETTASRLYVGSWDDPTESLSPFWSIPFVVRRSNCFLDPKLAEKQRDIYNPRDMRYIFGLLKDEPDPWFVIWHHYKALSNGIQDTYGRMDVNTSMEMVRNVYHGGYDPIWKIILSFRSGWETWWQWIACPETGEFIITFAKGQTSAHWNNEFKINFLETLENKQPS